MRPLNSSARSTAPTPLSSSCSTALACSGDAFLAKLDSFRDRIVEGPVKGVLEMGDTILDSLIAAIDILEPLKEIKDTLKNKIEFGADGDITQLKIYPYKPRPY